MPDVAGLLCVVGVSVVAAAAVVAASVVGASVVGSAFVLLSAFATEISLT